MSEEMGYVAKVAPELAAFIVPIDSVAYHPDNARQHRIEKIAQSLTTHGQRSPIIVQDSTNFIVKGNGTHEAAALLGWEHIAAVRQDMSNDEALEYLFADNRASDLSSYKRDKLLAGLEQLAEGPGILDTLFEISELEDLREEFRPIAQLPDSGSGEAAEDRPTGEQKAEQADKLPGAKLHEMPLLLTDSDYREVTMWIQSLQKEWGVKGVTDTIIMAIRYAVQHVGEAKPSEPTIGEHPFVQDRGQEERCIECGLPFRGSDHTADSQPPTNTEVSPLRQEPTDGPEAQDNDFPL